MFSEKFWWENTCSFEALVLPPFCRRGRRTRSGERRIAGQFAGGLRQRCVGTWQRRAVLGLFRAVDEMETRRGAKTVCGEAEGRGPGFSTGRFRGAAFWSDRLSSTSWREEFGLDRALQTFFARLRARAAEAFQQEGSSSSRPFAYVHHRITRSKIGILEGDRTKSPRTTHDTGELEREGAEVHNSIGGRAFRGERPPPVFSNFLLARAPC